MAGGISGKKAFLLTACIAALALGGCGGGGSGGTGARPMPMPAAPPPPPPPPPPAPASSPTPAPAPSSVNYNDAEYQRSNGAFSGGALSAYSAGGTGKGVKVGVIDSGINPDLAEFKGRIDPASQDVAGSRGLVDKEGHGSAVSAVIAANRDGAGQMGVAFEASIISLNTADAGDCGDDGCEHSDGDIARAMDIARLNGARVINISLGGEDVSSTMLAAVRRAAEAGIVVIMSAGNEGEKPEGTSPGGFALESAAAGSGHVIIAGAVDSTGQIASFSNRAGNGAITYLAALGVRVRSIDENGTGYLWSGTSFSAPIISGAAALLASAFPNLTGSQIVQLLLNTADEAGEAGTDAIYGRGILNIRRAFEPQGRTTVAGLGTPVSTSANGQGSSATGDAAALGTAGAIILDGYSRAYALNLAKTLASAGQEKPLSQSLHGNFRTAGAVAGTTAVSITVDRRLNGQPVVGLAQTGMSYEDARQAKLVAGSAVSRITPRTAVAFGFSESGRTLQQRLTGHAQNAFLVARDPMSRAGFYADASSSVGVRHDLGPVGLTVTSERGKVWAEGPRQTLGEPRYSIASVAADRKIGPATLSLGASRLNEESTMLGGRFDSVLTGAGAKSYFLDSTGSLDLGRGWGAYASYRRGWTSLPGSGGLVNSGRLATEAWAFDLSKRSAFFGGDKLALRAMQPLRVRSGGFSMLVPISYDYSTLSVGYADRFLNLAPKGREIDLEAAYNMGLLGGDLGLNAFYRNDPGHIEAMKNDIGGAIRFTLGF